MSAQPGITEWANAKGGAKENKHMIAALQCNLDIQRDIGK